jgi:hypothetical protein
MTPFASTVHEYFDTLAAANSMQCTDEQDYLVRYESDLVGFGIWWDRYRSYEVDLGFRLKSGGYHLPVLLPEILRFQGLDTLGNDIRVLRIQANEDCRPPLMKLAELTRKYGSRFLAGDPDTYASFAEHMERVTAEYNARRREREAIVRALYGAADEAWKSQDYHKVIELYGKLVEMFPQFADPLPPFARERVTAAEKILSDNRNKD